MLYGRWEYIRTAFSNEYCYHLTFVLALETNDYMYTTPLTIHVGNLLNSCFPGYSKLNYCICLLFLFAGDNNFSYVLHLSAKCGGIQSNAANPIDYFIDNMEQGINSTRSTDALSWRERHSIPIRYCFYGNKTNAIHNVEKIIKNYGTTSI